MTEDLGEVVVTNRDGYKVLINMNHLNDARWAACNMRWSKPPSMEDASEAATQAVLAWLRVDREELPDGL